MLIIIGFCPKIWHIYTKTLDGFTDCMTSAAKIALNTTFANMQGTKMYMQQFRDIVKLFSKMGVTAAKTFGGPTSSPSLSEAEVDDLFSTAPTKEDVTHTPIQSKHELTAPVVTADMAKLKSYMIELLQQ